MADIIPHSTLPPQDLDAERALLGSVFLRNDFLPEALPFVTTQSFYLEAHGQIWSAITDLVSAGTPADDITLPEELRKRGQYENIGGEPYLIRLGDSVPNGAYAGHYSRIVREKYQRRQAIYSLTDALRTAYSDAGTWPEPLHAIDSTLQSLLAGTTEAATADVSSCVADALMQLAKPKQPGVQTGIAGLDRLTNGLQPGQLVIVAARPGVGKSAFALSVARNVALQSSVLFITLEMSNFELSQRLLSAETGIPTKWLHRAVSDESQAPALDDASQRICRLKSRLHLCDTARQTTRDIAGIARLTKRKHGLGLLIVDYLQLISPSDPKQIREQQIATMTRELKLLAKSLGVPLMLLCQLNRDIEKRDSKTPRLSDLRESGAIEQDADIVLFLDRSEADDAARIHIAKHRNGQTGVVDLNWDAPTMTFASPLPEPCEWGLPGEVNP